MERGNFDFTIAYICRMKRVRFHLWVYIGVLIYSFLGCEQQSKSSLEPIPTSRIKKDRNQLVILTEKLNKGSVEGIIPEAEALLGRFKSNKDSLEISQAYDLIAKCYYFQQQIDLSILNWKNGLQYAPATNDEIHSSLFSNLGSAYMFKGYQRTAISYFLEARRIFDKSNTQSDNSWINYLNIGVCYMELSDFETAYTYFNGIPYSGNKVLDFIVPLNFAKLYGLQSDKKNFSKYIAIAIRNQDNIPFYKPILKEVHLEFTEKLGSNLELQRVFTQYKQDFKRLNTTFDLSLWKASIKLGRPLGSLDDLEELQESINNADYYLLISYYKVLSEFYESKNDYKNALVAKGLMEFCENKSEQKDAMDKLYDFTLLAKRNELQKALINEQQRNSVQEIKLRNRSIILYFLLTIFILLISTSILIFNNQRRKNKLNKNKLIIQDLELKLTKEKQNKLENTLEFTDRKLYSILETVGKIAILKKQLDDFFLIMEKKPDLEKEAKSLVKEAKLDFNLFFNNYQDLAVLSNLKRTESSKVELIKEKYPMLKENEFRLILMIIQNYTSKEMALLLSCSEKNIEYYRSQIRKKLEIPKDQLIHEFIELNF